MATWLVRHVRDEIARLGVAVSVFGNVEMPPDELAFIVGGTLDALVCILHCAVISCPGALACISSGKP